MCNNIYIEFKKITTKQKNLKNISTLDLIFLNYKTKIKSDNYWHIIHYLNKNITALYVDVVINFFI